MSGLSSSPVWPTLAVRDMAKARQFYENVLGYQPMMSSDENVAYQGAGNTGVSLYHSDENAGTNKATYAVWMVDEIEAVMNDLRGKGVTFEDYDMPGIKTENGLATSEDQGISMKMAWFKDPDGNILAIMQMSKPAA